MDIGQVHAHEPLALAGYPQIIRRVGATQLRGSLSERAPLVRPSLRRSSTTVTTASCKLPLRDCGYFVGSSISECLHTLCVSELVAQYRPTSITWKSKCRCWACWLRIDEPVIAAAQSRLYLFRKVVPEGPGQVSSSKPAAVKNVACATNVLRCEAVGCLADRRSLTACPSGDATDARRMIPLLSFVPGLCWVS